jgi:hypothetical protein
MADAPDWTDDTPRPLDEAARLAFPDGGATGGCNRRAHRFGSGATALDYLEVPSPIRRRLSRNSKSKRGIHNLACGRQIVAADNCRRWDWPK